MIWGTATCSRLRIDQVLLLSYRTLRSLQSSFDGLLELGRVALRANAPSRRLGIYAKDQGAAALARSASWKAHQSSCWPFRTSSEMNRGPRQIQPHSGTESAHATWDGLARPERKQGFCAYPWQRWHGRRTQKRNS